MRKCKVISIINQKGGVGKTTTSVNLSVSLAFLGKKVLLIDFDPQGNATTGLDIKKSEIKNNIYTVLKSKCSMKEAMIKIKYNELYLIPSTINLVGINYEFIKKDFIDNRFSIQKQLKKNIDEIRKDFDYIIIDCHSSLDLLTINALTASNSAIIPVQCEYFAMEGLLQIQETIKLMHENLNSDLNIDGILITMLNSRIKLCREIIEDIQQNSKEKVYKTMIPRTIKFVEASSHGKPIIAYRKHSKGAKAYLNLAKEIINGE